MRAICFFLLIVSLPLLPSSQGASSAQSLSATFTGLACHPVGTAGPLRSCGTPTDHLLRTQLAVGQAMANGEPLRADQFPRFLAPTHAGSFGFDGFAVLGDYETLAVVTQSRELTNLLGFHRNVRNDVAGIGLELFDDTASTGARAWSKVWRSFRRHDGRRTARYCISRRINGVSTPGPGRAEAIVPCVWETPR